MTKISLLAHSIRHSLTVPFTSTPVQLAMWSLAVGGKGTPGFAGRALFLSARFVLAPITFLGANFDVINQQKYLARTLLSLETAMANKNDFTPEEWTKVLESIIAAGIAVSAVDPSGWWGTLKEAAAGTPALAAAKRDPNSNELIKAA